MGRFILVTGGTRSGKSAYALELGSGMGGRRAFLATAEALDDEMRERIERHRRERGDGWETIEETVGIAGWLESNGSGYDVVVLDCLTIWLSNVLMKDMDVEKESRRLVDAMAASPCRVIAVTNEVGMGIVPESPLAREFRDLAGRLNSMAAERADEVFMMVAGIPLRVKEKGKAR